MLSVVPCLLLFYYSTIYYLAKVLRKIESKHSFTIFLCWTRWKSYFSSWFWQKSTSIDLFLGTFWEQPCNFGCQFFLNLNHIPSPFHILGRNAQYFWMVNESFSVESCFLQDEVRYIKPIFPFFDSPFSSKGKRKKRGWRIEADDWHLRPVCSSMVTTRTDGIASGEYQVYLNVIPCHDGRTRRETHSCKAKVQSSLQLYPVVFTCHV